MLSPGHATIDDFERGVASVNGGGSIDLTSEVIATTIRNPYDMIVTWWITSTAQRVPLAEFIRGYEGRHQVIRGRIYSRADDSDIVLRYETLDRDLADMLRLLRLPAVELSRDNVTPSKKKWQTYYDVESFAIVNERFGREIEDYGYKCMFQ